jgi:hypothetical protein
MEATETPSATAQSEQPDADTATRVNTQPEQADWNDRSAAPFWERVLLRALIDVPEFAARFIPALDPDYFWDPATATIYTFVAENYERYQTAPDFNMLRLMNDDAPDHSEATVKVVDAAIRELERMPSTSATQGPSLMERIEAWMWKRKAHTLLSRVVQAHESGTDPSPLIDRYKAAYERRLDETATSRYAFKNLDTLLNSPAAPFLVRNLLVQNSLVALVSPPGSNKTFVALDLALSVASRQPTWLGEPLNVSGPVVYVLGEGGGRIKLRVQAWNQEHGITATYPFHYINEPVALTKRTEADAFVHEVAALKPVLIVFDTLSRCLAGADENNQKDMSAAVSVCDTLRQQLGCTVLLLHHTTKDGSTERGSSVLRGAVDTLLKLDVPDASAREFTMTCDKQKDAEPFADIALVREQVTLTSERDADTGDPTVSCVVKVATGAQVSQHANRRLWKAQQFMLKHPQTSKSVLAEHLGGRKADRLQEIAAWELRRDIQFQRKRQRDPLASMKAEQCRPAG